LATSWMIGDSKHDIEAGRSAGCRTAWVTEQEGSAVISANVISASLLDAVQKILQVR